jgi:crotonobetainyl-CoA:carnitine CoA-transferase CaiB-like acyl-CoA transferase
MILANLGADVIKVERVGTGEDARAMGPHRGDWGAYFTPRIRRDPARAHRDYERDGEQRL